MEAALRSVYEIYTGRTLENVNFEQVRGLAGVRRATIDLDGFELKVGIAHGLGNARQLLEDIRHGRNEYHVIEIMACPGGCIGGGRTTVASWQLGGAVCTCQCTVSGRCTEAFA